MIPGQFEYVRPAGLHDALRILSEREGEAKVLSGGYSLLLRKIGLDAPALMMDVMIACVVRSDVLKRIPWQSVPTVIIYSLKG